jgi:hypothetical protein
MNESITARWLLAMIAAPVRGTFLAPMTHGLYARRSNGPTNRFRITQ